MADFFVCWLIFVTCIGFVASIYRDICQSVRDKHFPLTSNVFGGISRPAMSVRIYKSKKMLDGPPSTSLPRTQKYEVAP
jgi:hypothetical protein